MSAENETKNAQHVASLATSKNQSLSTLYSECLASYRTFLVRCSQDDRLRSNQGLEKCHDEYSRLKIWGHQKKAALGVSVPDSLEAMLSDSPELQQLLSEIYEQIIYSFSQLHPLSWKSLTESLETLENDIISDDDDVSESGSDASNTPDADSEPGAASTALRSIFENIDELFRFGNLIRLLGSTARSSQSFQSTFAPAYQQEYQHVKQMLLIWQKQQEAEKLQNQVTAAAPDVEPPPEEEPTTPEVIASRYSAEQSFQLMLPRRLAAANMKRRRQLLHITDNHPSTIESETSQPIIHTAPTLLTIPTVAKSSNFPGQLDAYKEEVVARDENYHSSRVPNPPLPSRSNVSFECPFCHTTLDAEEMRVWHNWEHHVLQDLRPYICTFADCSDPDRLFATRYDWVYHEMQLHRRRWVCRLCSCEFYSESEMIEHITRTHDSSITNGKLSIVIEMSEQQLDEDYVDKCPFCYGKMNLGKLLDHMASHMEELSLFALPQIHKGAEETGEELPHITIASQLEGAIPDTQVSLESSDKLTDTPAKSSSVAQSENKGGKDHNLPKKQVTRKRAPGRTVAATRIAGSANVRRDRVTTTTIFYCCNCRHGPWNVVTTHCPNCQHMLCSFCRAENIKIQC
ncbi:hypothetical protein F4802DRAFT_20177 [Xylaria palmicola]|nr:hypothetical protein F4802DRAFT_20177 [Xylaria palmicola]